MGFPGGSVVKNSPATGAAGDSGSIPGSGRSPRGGHPNPLQYSCLENPMDRGAWWATVYRVEKSRIQLKRLSTHTHSLELLQTMQLWPFLHVLHMSPGSQVHAIMLNIHRNGITGAWGMFSSLIPKMLTFTLAISCWTTSNLPWFMDLTFQIPMQYTTSDFTSITSRIQNWVLFLLWLCLFIFSGVISTLFFSSIMGTYRPGEFIFWCPIFLPYHTVYGVLKARTLKWFAIAFSSGPRFVRTLHHEPSVLGGPTWHGS